MQQALVLRGAVDRAVVGTGSRRPWRRARAAQQLGAAADHRCTPVLVGLLADPASGVARAAARALGTAGDPAAVPHLLDAAVARDAEHRLPAGLVAMALLDLGTVALPGLRAAVTAGPPRRRAVASQVLGLHGDVAAGPALRAVLMDPHGHPQLRSAACRAVGRIGHPAAVPDLVTVLLAGDRPDATPALRDLRPVAAEALGSIGDPGPVELLRTGLASPHSAYATACADALVRCGPEGMAALAATAAGEDGAARLARATTELTELRRPRRPEPAVR